MNRIYHRIRDVAASGWRGVTAWRGPHSRVRVIVAAGAATVLAIGVGVVWGLAGATDQRPEAAGRLPSGAPEGSPGAGLDPLGSLDPLGGGGSSTGGGSTGGGSSTGGGLPGGAGSGPGSGDGGGPAGNRPPVIEDPGLSSDGMTLTIAPTVTDPDGDEVEVGYDDGSGLVLVSAQPTRTYPVRDSADGYRYPVEVTIHATDVHGVVTEQTVSHELAAISTVVVRTVELKLQDPKKCFADTEAERFTADLRLRRAVVLDRHRNVELRRDKTTASLLPNPVEGEVVGERPLQDVFLANAQLAGGFELVSLPFIQPPVQSRPMFQRTRCPAEVTIEVQITTR